jgi:hypothetical protein
MVFQFFPSRKGDHHHHDNAINATRSKDSTDSNLLGRGQRIMKTILSGKDKHQNPVTPSFRTRPTTPATIVMDGYEGPASTDNKTTTLGFEIHYRDTVTVEAIEKETLEEQERIRQQLFEEEEGIEVTARFRPSASQQQQQQQQPQPHSSFSRHEEEEEEKKEETTESSSCTPESSIKKKKKRRSKSHPKRSSTTTAVVVSPDHETSIPNTPYLHLTEEYDPVNYFPAVTAAQAKAKERQEKLIKEQEMKRIASLASASAASSAQQSAESRLSVTVQKKTKSIQKVKSSHVVSPGRPFDEDGPEDEYDINEKYADAQDEGGKLGESHIDAETEAQKLLELFHCGDDFTEFSGSAMAGTRSCRLVDSFYDSTCGTYLDATQMKRPFYDELFAQRFLKVSEQA